MYKIVIAPNVSDTLIKYAGKFAQDNDIECALNLTDSFDQAIDSLKSLPQRGIKKLKYIPHRYHLITFWKHLWLVYQIKESEHTVYIDFFIDNRSDYGKLF